MIRMRLHNEPFCLIKKGEKRIEARLYDKKRRVLFVDDIIEITNRKTKKKLLVKIVKLQFFKSFKNLYDNFEANVLGENEKEKLIKDIYKYYSKEDEKKLGVLAIRFELV